MSWRTEYRRGSFRGVPFRTAASDRDGGRRGVLHEFPGRDVPWFEDMGAASKAFRLSVWVAGDDYRAQRDALEAALDAAGPGQLVHPFKGTLVVAVPRYSVRESSDEGGYAEFDIEFQATSGTAQGPTASADTRVTAQASAGTIAQTTAPARFAKRFSVDALPAFVEDAATTLVEGAALAAKISAARMGGAGAVLRTFDAGLRLLPQSARALVRTPLALAQATVGLIHALGALHSSAPKRVAAMREMAAFGSTLKPVTGTTPARMAQARNQAAYVALVRTVAAAGMVDALSRQAFASYDDAAAARADLADVLDGLARDAADDFDDDALTMIKELRAAALRDLTVRGASLVRSYQFTPARTEPALVIARRLSDDTGAILDRAADLVVRNRVRHPAMVRGGNTLDVLPEAANG